jgi:hypothetical protein
VKAKGVETWQYGEADPVSVHSYIMQLLILWNRTQYWHTMSIRIPMLHFGDWT